MDVKKFDSLTRSELRRKEMQMTYKGYKGKHRIKKDGRYYAEFTKDESNK